MSIELDGINEVLKMLDGVVDRGKLNASLGKACALVERSAKQKAPKVNGELRRSITSKVENDEGIIFTALEYAPYVEYGTGLFAEGGKGRQEVPWVYVEGSTKKSSSKTVYPTPQDAEAAAAFLQSKGLDAVVTYGMHPQPYMRPALFENREEILRILKEAINND